MQNRPPRSNPPDGFGQEPALRRGNEKTPPRKPTTTFTRPELTRLPRLTLWRRTFRKIIHLLACLAIRLCTRCQVSGISDFPKHGPALVVTNHLGDADVILAAALLPAQVEGFSKIDLIKDYPLVGLLMEAYGVIWVHRGQPDRRALRAALKGLREGRIVAIAPEGRESLIGGLEEGTGGAAYLALKTGAPVTPVVFTGTENRRVYSNLSHLRRTQVSLTVGPSFFLPRPQHKSDFMGRDLTNQDEQKTPGDFHNQKLPDKEAIHQGTQTIMLALARMLPPEYRGLYQNEIE
jgi:1-acyl-sn-glycerol-3-phosphate acyltransferase